MYDISVVAAHIG